MKDKTNQPGENSMTYYSNPVTGFTINQAEWNGTSGACGYRLMTQTEAEESESEKAFFEWSE